jgi:hypothetical protein
MERRQALAWAGSITLTAGATTLVLGSHLGGFGLGPSPPPETQVTRAGPKAGGNEPRPTPESTGSRPAPGGAGATPAPGAADARPAPRSVPRVRRDARSPTGGGKFPASVPISPLDATTSLSGASVPPSSHPDEVPSCDVAVGAPPASTRESPGATAAAAPGLGGTPADEAGRSKAPGHRVIAAAVPGVGGTPGRRDDRSEGSGHHGAVGTTPEVDTFGTWIAQLIASVLGQSPGDGDTKAAAEHHAANGRDGPHG